MAKKKKKPVDDYDMFDIDLSRLEEEWVNQPKRFFVHASRLTKARKKESIIKAARDVIISDIDLKVRKNLKKYGIDNVKLTEAVILGVVRKQPKYIKAQNRRLQAKYRVGICQDIVNASLQRKSALENEVKLLGQNYFSAPQASRKDAEQIQKKAARNKTKRNKK